MNIKRIMLLFLAICSCTSSQISYGGIEVEKFTGVFCDGTGDRGWLQMLDDCWLVLDGSGELCSLMKDCYLPNQDRFDEGPGWRYGFWSQNSFGMIAWLPTLPDDKLRSLKRSYDLLYAAQGDGHTPDFRGFAAPVGAMPDASLLEDSNAWMTHLRQGDGEWGTHDCMVESSVADAVFMAEYFLATRDTVEIVCGIQKLENCLEFIEARRDPANGLFRVGPAGNLLAPSYAGTRMEDGKYSWGYHAGVHANYCAALARVIEVEKLMGRKEQAERYAARLDATLKTLPQLMTEDGYLMNYIDQKGIRHGVYGEESFGYIMSTSNHDAIAFGVLDLEASRKCYAKMKSVEGLWFEGLVRNNYPALDDTYQHWGKRESDDTFLWKFGAWVDGGIWGTNVARMLLAQFRLGEYDDARKCLDTIMAEFRKGLAPAIWKLPDVACPGRPNELDTYAVMGAALRGLFEYGYDSEAVTLRPHVPPAIKQLTQKQPIRFGRKRIMIAIDNGGSVLASATLNGEILSVSESIRIPYASLRDGANKLALVTTDGHR